MYNYSIEIADRCGEILAKSRTNAGLSRKVLSQKIGISESTIKAWEMGQGSPGLPLMFEWFNAAGCNPFRYLLDFFWPEHFRGLTYRSNDDELRKALNVYINETASQTEIKRLYFLVFNRFGGEWSGILDLFCAHAHTSINSRCRIAEIIETSYELSLANDTKKAPEIKLNRPLFSKAIRSAKASAMVHKDGYIVGPIKSSLSDISSMILTKSRCDSGVTQGYMAKAMGKSERTIQNWETSYEPSFLEICLWFHVLDKRLWNYLRNALDPNELLGTNEEDKRLRSELISHFEKADSQEIRKLSFLILGEYGSYWSAVLEMMVEYACIPIYQRILIARSILISYELDQNDKISKNENDIHPDLDNLKECIDLGISAAKKGGNTYIKKISDNR